MTQQVPAPSGSARAGRRARLAGRWARWLLGAAATAVAAAAAGGCGGPAAVTRPDPDGVPLLLRSADLRLPLDDFSLSVAEGQRLARAGRALLSQCVRGFGFDYTAPDPAPTGPGSWTERRYGLTDPAQAAGGYWAADRLTAARAGRPANTATAVEGGLVTGRGPQVVRGRRVPAGGCAAQARRRLTAGDPAGTDQTLAQRLGSDTFFASQQDPRVRAVFGQWSACMRAAGYSYAGPLDPPKDARFQGAISTTEIATAKADVVCKRQTNLVGVWFTVEAGQQRPLIEANRAALRRARTAFQAELAVATGVGV
ncbi:MAG: hypothetical protein V7637_5254 [Mycobacteriales bacterium]